MNFMKDYVFCEEKFPCENKTCCDFLCNEDSHSPNFVQDPVVQHSLKLREYLLETNCLLEKLDAESARLTSEGCVQRIESLKPVIGIPPFPKDKQRITHSKTIRRMKWRNELDLNVVEEALKHFVNTILVHSGYAESNQEAIEELVKTSDRFLKKFTGILCETTDITHSEDALIPLDFSLERIGFGGIEGLRNFYQEQVVKKHELLQKACKKRYTEIINWKGTSNNVFSTN